MATTTTTDESESPARQEGQLGRIQQDEREVEGNDNGKSETVGTKVGGRGRSNSTFSLSPFRERKPRGTTGKRTRQERMMLRLQTVKEDQEVVVNTNSTGSSGSDSDEAEAGSEFKALSPFLKKKRVTGGRELLDSLHSKVRDLSKSPNRSPMLGRGRSPARARRGSGSDGSVSTTPPKASRVPGRISVKLFEEPAAPSFSTPERQEQEEERAEELRANKRHKQHSPSPTREPKYTMVANPSPVKKIANQVGGTLLTSSQLEKQNRSPQDEVFLDQ